jgi:hypothetical protein
MEDNQTARGVFDRKRIGVYDGLDGGIAVTEGQHSGVKFLASHFHAVLNNVVYALLTDLQEMALFFRFAD